MSKAQRPQRQSHLTRFQATETSLEMKCQTKLAKEATDLKHLIRAILGSLIAKCGYLNQGNVCPCQDPWRALIGTVILPLDAYSSY